MNMDKSKYEDLKPTKWELLLLFIVIVLFIILATLDHL